MPEESQKIVLIADDEDDIREIMSFHVRQAGFAVREASDGQEAFQILSSRTIDVVLCDLRMPKCDGSTLLKRTRSMLGLRIPFAFISADTSESVEDLLRLNSQAVFSKPFQMQSIIQWLRTQTSESAAPVSSENGDNLEKVFYATATMVDETNLVLSQERFVVRIVQVNGNKIVMTLPARSLRNGQLLCLSASSRDDRAELSKFLGLESAQVFLVKVAQSSVAGTEMTVQTVREQGALASKLAG